MPHTENRAKETCKIYPLSYKKVFEYFELKKKEIDYLDIYV
jgi:vacuolar-type H+-ATPase subunit C/Vma6